MGILEELGTNRRTTLGPRYLIGRHAACDLRPQDPRVSGEHAIVRWIEGRWELKDLGSKNGTFLDGRRLGPGERTPLGPGAVVTLGGEGVGFVLVDATAPVPAARGVRTGEIRSAADHVLVLPSEDRPLVTVFEDSAGRWVAEREEGTAPVEDHALLVVEGEPWQLLLPTAIRATWDASAGLVLEAIGLRFSVSPDEEHVDVSVLHDSGVLPLAPRAYHYVLLTLARARAEDRAGSPDDRGWVDRDVLCGMLGVDQWKLNVDVCRIRKQLAEMGIHGAASIVARRPGTAQLRIGVDRLEIITRKP